MTIPFSAGDITAVPSETLIKIKIGWSKMMDGMTEVYAACAENSDDMRELEKQMEVAKLLAETIDAELRKRGKI